MNIVSDVKFIFHINCIIAADEVKTSDSKETRIFQNFFIFCAIFSLIPLSKFLAKTLRINKLTMNSILKAVGPATYVQN